MDKFQIVIMEKLINDYCSVLTAEQFETFTKYLVQNCSKYKIDSKLSKKLYHKIAQSHMERSDSVAYFMNLVNYEWHSNRRKDLYD